MKVISLTGGVGSGKSAVLKLLDEEYGAEVILADLVARQVMEPGESGYEKIIELFGTGFLAPDKSIDRTKMADQVFKDKESVGRVNAVIHPLVWNAIEVKIAASSKTMVVVEAALFDEVHNAMFDEIWYVYTSVEIRIKRLMENRGYTREKCLDIMANQATEETFRSFADRVINNNGSVEDLRGQLTEILKEE